MFVFIRKTSASLRSSFRLFYTATASMSSESSGLYGFHHLKTPQGFQRFVDDAIERSNELIDYIAEMPPAPDIVKAMDELSDTVCTVIDSAELCRHTHPDREYVEEAGKASLRINDYLNYLNSNHTMYKAAVKAEQDAHLLTEEARRTAKLLRHDLEKGGIHLSSDKLDRANQLSLEIIHLCREFNENIISDPGHVDIFPTSRLPKRLHHIGKPIYRLSSGASGSSLTSAENYREKGWRIITEPSYMSSILQFSSDPEVRKMAYIQGNSVPRANLGVLEKLIAARHEFSQIMGHESYAEFALQSNMASSPEVARSFLVEMSEMVRPQASKEFKTICEFKREKMGQLSGNLEPWDEAYYTGMMRSSTHNLDYLVTASYFPLQRCIEGLKIMTESLFGVTFHMIPAAPGEAWHPDVLKISLHDPQEGDLGYLYLDLKSRKGKPPVHAHFAIKGGRRISETEYQLPVVALVCSFHGSNLASVRLSHSDLETLFHEFGHALHSLLSRTDFQHLSGTRVALDFAETPSNLFEYYAWDYRVLSKFARHYSTGDVIPEELVKSMLGSRNMFAATELQRQILYSLVDQELYGKEPSSMKDMMADVANLQSIHTCWKNVEGTHWPTRFSHFVTYGAGYYSYLYARCFAATIWQKICQDDPLSLATGSAIREKMLQHGGAKDPALILSDLGGNGTIRHRNGGIIPDISCLQNEMELK
ncbi:metalloprotease [Lithospermum erythrorhizon]|uniref:Metalloprotease n=1 Tax=Lithospermum erythrorhizon TaxID=34254 RepID=A0AAV3PHH7_LITER